MSDSPFDDYLARWRGAAPQREIAWLFLRPDERRCFGALAALEVEWTKALREVTEPQVAAMKLGWWREELERALQGRASHPLTQALFTDARARAVPLGCWMQPVEAAIAAIGAPPAADFARQCAAATPFADAIAELETRVWYGDAENRAAAARATLGAHLLAGLRAVDAEVTHGRSPVPMNLLARHELTVDGLAKDGPERRGAIRDEAIQLRALLDGADALPGRLTLFRAVALRHDRVALAHAARADAPLAALRAPPHGFSGVVHAWSAARSWRRSAHPRRAD